MLRAIAAFHNETKTVQLFSASRRVDVFKVFCAGAQSAAAHSSPTVLTSDGTAAQPVRPPSGSEGRAPPPPLPPPPPPSPQPRRSWTVTAAALTLTASFGGVYLYRKLTEDDANKVDVSKSDGSEATPSTAEWEPVPALGEQLPQHVPYLVVGAGTAAFAALRAIRSARPDSRVLLVGDERALPYMRPPLSKELWREPDLASRLRDPDALTFRQWNGRRRSIVYEPSAFYTPVERLSESEGGAAVARGWRVTRLDVVRHEAQLTAPGRDTVTVRYDKCLIATGVRPARIPALRDAAAAGLSLTLRGLRDAQTLAAALEEPRVRRVVIVGGGFLACELSAALAERLHDSGKTVVQVFREREALAGVLPEYLAAEATRRLSEAGVQVVAGTEVAHAEAADSRVRMALSSGERLDAELVVECAGAQPDTSLAVASGLEVHPQLDGIVVNAELQARSDVYAAGDVACFHDVALGRRRVEHHDHAVVSGRLAGENMVALTTPKHYKHQSMFWSDLGPQLGYEAIGIIDSRLPTVGVFSADAVSDARAAAEVAEARGADAEPSTPAPAPAPATPEPAQRRYERGVVFYLREKRVVGVLLWNLFNRMHVARQVLAQGEFEDLFEVAKLFSPHEED